MNEDFKSTEWCKFRLWAYRSGQDRPTRGVLVPRVRVTESRHQRLGTGERIQKNEIGRKPPV